MLGLAGEIADVVHMASWFINLTHYRANLGAVRTGAERAGRTLWQVVTTPGLQSAYAVCFGYGMILTWSCLGYYRHYHILSFPFMFAWLAFLAVGRPEARAVVRSWSR